MITLFIAGSKKPATYARFPDANSGSARLSSAR